MAKNFDAVLESIQQKIFAEAKEAFGEVGFHHWRHPVYRRRLADADAHSCIKGRCGDTMEIFLKFVREQVAQATFLTDGCASSTVCGSFAAELAIGKSPDEISAITGEAILANLGRLSEEEQHCAFLAADALQEALNKYMIARVKAGSQTGR